MTCVCGTGHEKTVRLCFSIACKRNGHCERVCYNNSLDKIFSWKCCRKMGSWRVFWALLANKLVTLNIIALLFLNIGCMHTCCPEGIGGKSQLLYYSTILLLWLLLFSCCVSPPQLKKSSAGCLITNGLAEGSICLLLRCEPDSVVWQLGRKCSVNS